MRSRPLAGTLLLGLIMLGLALPVWLLTHREDRWKPTPEAENVQTSEGTLRCDLFVKAAHPYERLTVKFNQTTQVELLAGRAEVEVFLPKKEDTAVYEVSVVWPAATPETAVELELVPDGLPEQKWTIWGEGEVYEEIVMQWEDD